MQKKSFLLLEVLIAFSVVTMCVLPLVEQPLKLYRKEMAHLEQMEKERLADWTFVEVKEALLKHEIPWEKIPEKGEVSTLFPLPPKSVEIPGCKTKRVERSFQIRGAGEKVGLQKQTYRQLEISIFLDQKKYGFRLPVQRIVE